MSDYINRRKFVARSALSAAGLLVSEQIMGIPRSACSENAMSVENPAKPYNLMKDVMNYRKLDSHVHAHLFDGGPEGNISFANRLGIDRMYVSLPAYSGEGTPKEFRSYNDLMLNCMKQYPDRLIGQFTLNAIYQKESLEEIKRCVDMGMVGLKVYTQLKINDPLFYPIIEKMIDLKMIIHMHAYAQLGLGGYRMKYDTGIRPNTSIPEDFVEIAKKYPEAMFQYAHIGGGGDWEYACKMFAKYPNIYVDTSGSNNAENMVDFAVKCMGEDRVFFGSDNCYYQSVGKILAADLTEVQKKKVFFDNYNAILKKSGRNVD
ncbi:MAG: amidohydrolase family protein [Daejeonella sp.]|uniref:amidohydrolase family protein n=1 Tax=Daejeonella sp. TaxID=2805397 RepID=UPI00273648FB|nr:amidohydrolase family protein [Daejeonella sp.]MDP3468416.1 amidohydrolase family protein [Daejeonella sp.]